MEKIQKYLSRISLKIKLFIIYAFYAMCKIEFLDLEIRKMRRSNVIELFTFSIEKVWKMIFKHVWEP